MEAFDDNTAKSLVQGQLGRADASIKAIRIATMGKKGLFGFGKKPNRYEVEVVFQAVVEITYKTKAVLSIVVGEPPGNISVLVFQLWSHEPPPNPESYCRKVLNREYPGAFLWSHYVVGYFDNLTTGEASDQYRRFVFNGQLPDLVLCQA